METKDSGLLPPMAPEEFKKLLEEDIEASRRQPRTREETALIRGAERAHKTAKVKWGRAHRRWMPGSDVLDVEGWWNELFSDLFDLALMNRENPAYGALEELRYGLADLVGDFRDYAEPLYNDDWLLAKIVGEIKEVYEAALRRSDARVTGRKPYAAAPLTPAEHALQTDEIEELLKR